ncbi:MAG: Gfo/Idh/MocA family oxidoreductase [Acidobacteriia bacterium]|nr:Gfo/Idh/MocA family oxidoreductase [Terriglobia bacterium]
MSAAIRIGFIGSGNIAATHMRVLSKDSRARIAGVYDVSPERAKASGADAFASIDALLEASDAVYITTPNRLHPAQALRAIEQRKHVFCEKPMAVTREDAARVEAAAASGAASGMVFQVGHNRRFAPVYQRVKQALAEEPALAADFKMNRGELENPAWTSDDAVTGGYLFETPIHIFDMARFLMGEVASITAVAESLVYPTLDTFHAIFRFASGRSATFRSVAYTGWSFPFERVEVYRKHTTLSTEEMDRVNLATSLIGAVDAHDYRHLPWEQRWGYVTEDRLFLDSIVQGTPAAVTASDGAAAVKMALAIYESTQTGKEVQL